jgi:hypothetical protein
VNDHPWYMLQSKKEGYVFLVTGTPKIFGVNEFHLPRWLAEVAIKGHRSKEAVVEAADLSEEELERLVGELSP